MKTETYTYNMHDQDFQSFCISRGYWHMAGKDKRFDIIADHGATRAQHDADAYFQTSETGYRYTETEMEVNWKVIAYAKARMQGYWNQFKGTSDSYESIYAADAVMADEFEQACVRG
jgi:hypothetical protein